jgi:hypothetical protein
MTLVNGPNQLSPLVIEQNKSNLHVVVVSESVIISNPLESGCTFLIDIDWARIICPMSSKILFRTRHLKQTK